MNFHHLLFYFARGASCHTCTSCDRQPSNRTAIYLMTGNFEVTLVSTGELIHSKTTRGQGRCETQAEKDAIFAKVRAYLEGQSA